MSDIKCSTFGTPRNADYASWDRLIHHLFETQARQVPRHIALCNAQTEMSYGDLEARANRLAHHLLAQGRGLAHASRSLR
jgi:non-ribosomal peptide synthetase component F